jgi:ribosomal protein S6
MLILKSDLNEEEREEIFRKIIQKIEGLEGKVKVSKVWAKEKEFCYPIRSRGAEKKKYNKGCYWLVEFVLDPQKLPELKETIRLEERILRNIIIKRDKDGES